VEQVQQDKDLLGAREQAAEAAEAEAVQAE
jgi:hypothetical protein